MSRVFRWILGVIDELKIPAGDSYSSRGRRPRNRVGTNLTLQGSHKPFH
jgi:hypothetical protein